MAYVTPTTIAVGDPVKKDDYDKVAENTINHETRILAAESGLSVIPIIGEVVSNLGQYVNASSTLEGLFRYEAKQDLTLTGATITDTEGAASGTYEFNVFKSSTIGGTYSTVFSTLPSLTADGSPKESTNAVFSTTAISTGDWVRIDITSVAVGAKNIFISLTASPA